LKFLLFRFYFAFWDEKTFSHKLSSGPLEFRFAVCCNFRGPRQPSSDLYGIPVAEDGCSSMSPLGHSHSADPVQQAIA
jgi:hypothetical protein